jgi:mannose-1-phosphate guanylyltransferase
MAHASNGGQKGLNKDEWAVILAGGDGTRLKTLTRRIAGDERPKQFCRILAGKTLLEQTRERVARKIASEKTMFVVNRSHEPFYTPLLADAAAANLLVQPANRGTTPAILYALLRIAAVDQTALVAFFPSDHYVSDDEGLMDHIAAAFEAVRCTKGRIILLGMHAETPEVAYGWIEPGDRFYAGRWPRLYDVKRFWEKPDFSVARVLQARGCLWNSFVMIAPVSALLEVIASAAPDVWCALAPASRAIGSPQEPKTIEDAYQELKEANFSHQVLASCPERLAVLEVTGVRWNDLGEPRRVMESLALEGLQPYWGESRAFQSA